METHRLPVPSGRSALRELLEHSVIDEEVGAPIPRALIHYGLLAAGITIAIAIGGLALRHPATLHNSGFLLLFDGAAASLGSVLHAAAVPLLCVGALSLTIGLCLLLAPRPRSLRWRHAVAAQAICGGSTAVIGGVFMAIFILNVAIWLGITVAVLSIPALALKVWADGS